MGEVAFVFCGMDFPTLPDAETLTQSLNAVTNDSHVREGYFAPLAQQLGRMANASPKAIADCIIHCRDEFLSSLPESDRFTERLVLNTQANVVKAVAPADLSSRVRVSLFLNSFERASGPAQQQAIARLRRADITPRTPPTLGFPDL